MQYTLNISDRERERKKKINLNEGLLFYPKIFYTGINNNDSIRKEERG